MSNRPDIFIVAGEPSGDLIASLMIRELRKLDPALHIVGVGGDKMLEAGCEIRTNIVRDLAIIGLAEVISKFPRIRRLFNDTLNYLKKKRPRVVVFIDYPGFNLRMAKQAHLLGLKVVYYVIPQVWAWHRSRIHLLRRFVDKALVVLPFEENLLRQVGANVEYVGHPLLDIMILTMDRAEVCRRFGLDAAKRLICLLPGSRKREVDALLPTMLEAAEKIREALPNTQFVLPLASSVRREQVDRQLNASPVPVTIVDRFRYNVRSVSDLALVASGTATLETGLLLTPMVILYKIAYPTWLIAKMIVQIPYIGLINIVAGDMVVPELIQDQCTSQNVADQAIKILNDPKEIEKIQYQLGGVKEKLGAAGASHRAAEVVYEICSASRNHPPETSGEDDRNPN